ncbi:MAG: class I SAM-dependent methyltransferase [Gammaproteobacteria bacterium]|nr:class I SAM-dependent methyltransferase [Gammaproteobacteria bacterium]
MIEFVVPMVSAEAEHYGDKEWYGERWEYRSCLAVTGLSGARILEIGCGEGHFAQIAEHSNNHTIGLDFNSAAIDRARQRVPRQTFIRADIKQIAQTSQHYGPFDMVAAFHVIEHLENILGFSRHCVSLLRAGGFFVLATPSQRRPTAALGLHEWWDTPPHHLTRWQEQSFAALAIQNKLRIQNIIYQDFDAEQLQQALRNKIYKICFSYFGNRTVLYQFTKLLAWPMHYGLRILQNRRGIFTGKSVMVVAKKIE